MSDNVNVSGENGAPTPTPPAQVAPQPTPTPAPAIPSNEPPAGYVPSYRLREYSEKLSQAQNSWTQKEAELSAKNAELQRKFDALAGVTPPPDPNISAVKGQFSQLYPGLSKLEEKALLLEQMLEKSGDIETQNQHYWKSYANQTMDKLYSKAAESIGPLSDGQKKQLHAQFVGYLQSSPELSQRYQSDPTIVEDFWKEFTSNFIDPVRRSAAAGITSRVPGALPQDTPGGAPRASNVPKPQSLDERVNMGWNMYNTPKT